MKTINWSLVGTELGIAAVVRQPEGPFGASELAQDLLKSSYGEAFRAIEKTANFTAFSEAYTAYLSVTTAQENSVLVFATVK